MDEELTDQIHDEAIKLGYKVNKMKSHYKGDILKALTVIINTTLTNKCYKELHSPDLDTALCLSFYEMSNRIEKMLHKVEKSPYKGEVLEYCKWLKQISDIVEKCPSVN